MEKTVAATSVTKPRHKTGLKHTNVSRDHWSVQKTLKPTNTFITIRLIEGKRLLASDMENGKSDPVCFGWCSSVSEPNPPDIDGFIEQNNIALLTATQGDNLDDTLDSIDILPREGGDSPAAKAPLASNHHEEFMYDTPIVMSKVCYNTCDPIWNEELFFPIEIVDLKTLLDLKIGVVVKDEDTVNDEQMRVRKEYDDLGQFEITVRDIISNGKVTNKNSICIMNKVCTLLKTKKMGARIDGTVKINAFITFCDDAQPLFREISDKIETVDKLTEALGKIMKAGGVESVTRDPTLLATILGQIGLHAKSDNPGSPGSTASKALNRSFSRSSIAPLMSARRGNPLEAFTLDEIKVTLTLTVPDPTLTYTVSQVPALHLPDLGDTEGDPALPPDFDQAMPPSAIEEPAVVVAAEGAGSSIDGKTLQGHTDVIRALRDIQKKDMEAHQSLLQKNFEELIRVTRDGFGTLHSRMESIEATNLTSAKQAPAPVNDKKLAKGVARAGRVRAEKKEFNDYLRSVAAGPPMGDESANPYEGGDPESELPPDGRRGGKSGRVPIKDLKKQHERQRRADADADGLLDGHITSSEPSVELVTKAADGSILQSRLVKSAVDAHNQSVDAKHAIPPTVATSVANSKHVVNNNYNIAGSKEGLPHSPLRSSLDRAGSDGKAGSRVYRGTDWGLVEAQLSRDPVAAFCEVLERGSLEDLARLLEMAGPHPEQLSVSVRNRTFDGIATLLANVNSGSRAGEQPYVERCLVWILAVLRGKERLSHTLVAHTRRDLEEALDTLAKETSKRGMLAGLLQGQLRSS